MQVDSQSLEGTMSDCDPRPAAAQRTAARKSTTRIVATWLVAVPLLALFSFSVVAGAATYGAKPPAAEALGKLPAATNVVVQLGATEPHDQSVVQRLTHVAKLVCSVDGTQLTAIQASYRTSTSSLTVDGRSVQVVSVYGADEKSIRGYLGSTHCVLVQVAQIFFLPFDAHTS
jgi:hypothetical protein